MILIWVYQYHKTYNIVNMSMRTPTLTIPNFARSKTNTSISTTPKRSPAKPIMMTTTPKYAPDTPYPHTPLITPKIGLSSNPVEKEDDLSENLWLPHNDDGNPDIKIAAMTPIGTIAMVPTANIRPIQTPRKQIPLTPGKQLTMRIIDPNTGNIKIDPLLTASVYFDSSDQDNKDVANKMRSIANNTLSLQKQYYNELKPIPNITGKVSRKLFDEALQIYENNQVYYQDRIDEDDMDKPTISKYLTELEHWFMCIIEPRVPDDVEGWKQREKSKLTKGVSAYCDPEVYPYIKSLPADVKLYIKQQHDLLKI